MFFVSIFQSVLKVVVPDELHGSILTKTLPARPHMTTKEVCKIIAHKARITNPQDYALYRLIDGEGIFIFNYYFHITQYVNILIAVLPIRKPHLIHIIVRKELLKVPLVV